MAAQDPLQRYKAKRNFAATPEPVDGGVANKSRPVFVVQKHWARRLHYDFRLELDGTMKSWAVPKGPSFDTRDRRLAVHVEDHPLSYNDFEGQIPAGQYGAGKVMVWDRGTWQAVGDAHKGYRNGKLVFQLHGHKLQGRWALIRMKGKSGREDPWLLLKEKDEYARPAAEFSVVDEMPDSVSAKADPGPEDKARTPAHVPAKGQNRSTNGSNSASKKSPDDKGSAKKLKSRKPAESVLQQAPPYKILPASLAPQLATLAKNPPLNSEDWLYEVKFDGYRLLTRIEAGRARLHTRNGHDWTDRLPELAAELNALALPDGWYDGEIVVLDDNGIPDFQQLQNAFDAARTASVEYFLFDLPFCDGHDLRTLPQIERRTQLCALLQARNLALQESALKAPANKGSRHRPKHAKQAEGQTHIRFSEPFEAPARELLASACHLGLEGIIAKRKNAPYVSRRSNDWLKLKCSLRQEFVVAGYTAPQGTRSGFGSLLLGTYDKTGKLQYNGNVGTGFNAQSLQSVHRALQAQKTAHSPFAADTRVPYRQVHWVKPVLVAEVAFAGWTAGGHVRQAVFHGLRNDKPAAQIRRETSFAAQAAVAHTPRNDMSDPVEITHAKRVIDASTKTTKGDLVRYYKLIGPLMMPHLAGRPLSFLRAPNGLDKKMFFQKHMATARLAGLRELPQKLDPEHEPLMEIAREEGLLSAAQMNVVEFHSWNAVKTAFARPDRMVFDLDPGQDTAWSAVLEAALLMQTFLQELQLVPFLKTSGGKGLHIIVPLQRRHAWDAVKEFSRQVVQHLATTFPDRFTEKSGPNNRVGKIFIDYLRNGFGATTVCAWSARARPGMAVSVPLGWNEVEKLSRPDRWQIANIHERLDTGNKPWEKYNDSARTLTAGRRVLQKLG